MAWPTDTLTHAALDAGTDDPSAARVELLALVHKVQEMIAAFNVASGVCPLDAGSQVPVGNLANATIPDATTTVKGKVELADQTEANALVDTAKPLCPGTVPIGSTTQKGILSVGSRLSVTNGVVSADLQASYPISVADGGTGATPTAGSWKCSLVGGSILKTMLSSYVKLDEIYVPRSGTYRVGFGAAMASAETGKARIYKNGAAVGTERTVSSTIGNYTWYTEDFTFSAGDLVQLYAHRGTGGIEIYVKSFCLGVASPAQPTNVIGL